MNKIMTLHVLYSIVYHSSDDDLDGLIDEDLALADPEREYFKPTTKNTTSLLIYLPYFLSTYALTQNVILKSVYLRKPVCYVTILD